jgi:hypothetical protein
MNGLVAIAIFVFGAAVPLLTAIFLLVGLE